jgi:regulator of sirC expression with transglutaminase-like and TPR domain
VDALDRFAASVAPERDVVPLDEAWALLGAHAHPDVSPEQVLADLDRLAERCPGPTLDHLLRFLFVDEGFVGNTGDYYAAGNSFAPVVLARRTGIPISLSVLTMEVGRRVGVPLDGVSMPGHFLLRDRVDPTVFVDPFVRGRLLDADGCGALFHGLHGPDARLDPSALEPVDGRRILVRMLSNLRATYAQQDDAAALAWVLRLLLAIPIVPRAEREALAAALGSTGRFDQAADQLEQLADEVGGEHGDEHRQAAVRLRARLN